jgi:hypothetical protein
MCAAIDTFSVGSFELRVQSSYIVVAEFVDILLPRRPFVILTSVTGAAGKLIPIPSGW